jgi:hypothetical protein
MIKSTKIQWQLNNSIIRSCDFSREIMPKISVSPELFSYAYNQEHQYDYESDKFNLYILCSL